MMQICIRTGRHDSLLVVEWVFWLGLKLGRGETGVETLLDPNSRVRELAKLSAI